MPSSHLFQCLMLWVVGLYLEVLWGFLMGYMLWKLTSCLYQLALGKIGLLILYISSLKIAVFKKLPKM